MPPIITIVGFSNVGKTTLIEKLVPALKRRGYRVGTVKHASHHVDIDHPGKDSWRHEKAGADGVAVVAADKIAVVHRQPHPSLEAAAGLLGPVDVILAEGFKSADRPKIEVLRQSVHPTPLFGSDPNLVALVTDRPAGGLSLAAPVLGLEDIEALAELIIARWLQPAGCSSARRGS
jgi:molybdopterin-guanine dinucleotide biosynthesis protein MobB